jgi:hypothetical protein
LFVALAFLYGLAVLVTVVILLVRSAREGLRDEKESGPRVEQDSRKQGEETRE